MLGLDPSIQAAYVAEFAKIYNEILPDSLDPRVKHEDDAEWEARLSTKRGPTLNAGPLLVADKATSFDHHLLSPFFLESCSVHIAPSCSYSLSYM